MSNIELSGLTKKTANGSVLTAEVKRSRNTNRNQQRKASRSRTKSKARSKSRPMTFSAIVKGTDVTMPPAEVRSRMALSEAPARVKAIKDHKDGGIVVETFSKTDRDKLVNVITEMNAGLEAHAAPPKPSRMVIMGVEPHLETAPFMEEVWSKNVMDVMELEEFKKGCNVVNRTAKGEIVLDVQQVIFAKWMKQRRVYVQWSSYRVRPFLQTKANICFKCFGVGHHRSECKAMADLCRKCGQEGHHAEKCVNEASCNNCKAAGKPHNHLTTSVSNCPIYGQAHLRTTNPTSNTDAE